MKDRVFATNENGVAVYRIQVNGHIVKATWADRGAALAGIDVEKRRQKKRKNLFTTSEDLLEFNHNAKPQ